MLTDDALTSAVRARLRDLSGPTAAGSTLVERLVDSFLTRAPAYLADIEAAVGRRDGEAVARLAHSLGGVAGNLGAAPVAELCERLETAPAGAFDELMERLRGAYAQARRAFDEIRFAPDSHPVGSRSVHD